MIPGEGHAEASDLIVTATKMEHIIDDVNPEGHYALGTREITDRGTGAFVISGPVQAITIKARDDAQPERTEKLKLVVYSLGLPTVNGRRSFDVKSDDGSPEDPPAPETVPVPDTLPVASFSPELRSSGVAVNEGDTAFIPVTLNKPATRDIAIKVLLEDIGTRSEYPKIADGHLGTRTVHVPLGETTGQLAFTVIDDVYPSDETDFGVTILPPESAQDGYRLGAEGTDSVRILVENGSYVLNELGESVFDNQDDFISIGWETCKRDGTTPQAEMTVVEDAGSFEVAIVYKEGWSVPYEYPLVLVNMEGSATRHNDYDDDDASGRWVVGPMTRRATTKIKLIDSNQVEELESFEISLFRNGISDTIRIDHECSIIEIFIVDDDVAHYEVKDVPSEITEGEDLNIRIQQVESGDCIVPFPINFDITVVEDNGLIPEEIPPATEGDDPTPIPTGLRIAPCIGDGTVTLPTIATSGTQGTRTITLDVGRSSNLDSRIFLRDENGNNVESRRFTINVVDDPNATDEGVIGGSGEEQGTESSTNDDPNNNELTSDEDDVDEALGGALGGGVNPPGQNVNRGVTNSQPRKPETPAVENITASTSSVPKEHLGSGTFDFQLHFSPAPTVSYRTLRDSFFSVTNGTVKKAKRLVAGQNTGWEIHVAPSGYGAVNLSASATSDCAASGAVCTDAGGKVSNSVNVTVPGPVRASVADASVTEGAGAGLDFAVTLSRSDTEQVTLRYATSDSAAARAGEDYEATSGTLTFAPGETSKTVRVAVLDDSHDEGEEGLSLTISNASPSRVQIARATATGGSSTAT